MAKSSGLQNLGLNVFEKRGHGWHAADDDTCIDLHNAADFSGRRDLG